MSETTDDEYSFATSSSGTTEADDRCPVPVFGCPGSNHGWVECNSKSFPGKTYFYNVDSRCSTWHRPISRFVPIPFSRPMRLRLADAYRYHTVLTTNHGPMNRKDTSSPRLLIENDFFLFTVQPSLKLKLKSDEDFSNVALMAVSDHEGEDEDVEDHNNNMRIMIEELDEYADVKPFKRISKEEKEKRTHNEILFKFYHCCGPDWIVDDPEEIQKQLEFQVIKQELSFDDDCVDCDDRDDCDDCEICCYSEHSDDDEAYEPLQTNFPNKSALSESLSSCGISGSASQASTLILNDWMSRENRGSPGKYFPNGNASCEAEMSRQNYEGVANCDVDIGGNNYHHLYPVKREESSTEDTDEDEDEKEDDKNRIKIDLFSPPKLRPIELGDLDFRDPITKKFRKRRAPRKLAMEADEHPSKVIKTIRELNGITTVNYDYADNYPYLPDGVIMSNLSDAGSSTFCDAWQANRDANASEPKSPIDEKDESAMRIRLLFEEPLVIKEPQLSDSSSSSESDDDGEGDSKSNDSSSSSSSSESAASSKSTKNQLPRTSDVAKTSRQRSSFLTSSSLSNSDESYIQTSSSDSDY